MHRPIYVVDVIDLTYLPNVKLFRAWDQTEFAYIQMLRFIRISSSDPTVSVISKPGRHHTLHTKDTPHLPDKEMDIPDVPKPTNDGGSTTLQQHINDDNGCKVLL